MSLRITSIFSLFLMVSAITGCNHKTSFKEYIEDNHVVVDLSKPYTDFEGIFQDDLAKHQVFFSSEEHAVSGNKKLEISLLEYFVRKAKVKYLLIEHGYCQAKRFNKYLETGDESVLSQELNGLKGTLSYTQEFFQYWQGVYQLNQQLSTENKIQVVGIDLDWLPSVHAYLLDAFHGADLTALPSLQKLLNDYDNTKPMKHYAQTFEDILIEYSHAGKDSFSKQQQFEISYIFNNLLHSIDAFAQENNLDIHRKRDEYMYENFLKLYHHLPKRKYFGQWGLNHVYQSPQLNVKWLASHLNTNEDSPVKNQVLSMATYYKNCERIKWRSVETEPLNNFTISEDSLGLRFMTSSIYLLHLNGEDSPFAKELLWYGPHKPDSGVTTDYYQYMIVENLFSASAPYK